MDLSFLDSITFENWLTICGGVLLLAGLLIAFISSHYTARVIGRGQLGVGAWIPERTSPEWRERENLLRRADIWFYIGLFLTAMGIILETAGSLLPF